MRLTHRRLDLLLALDEQPVTPAEYAADVGVSTRQVRYVVAGLADLGLIRRPARGRRPLTLTRRGRALIQRRTA